MENPADPRDSTVVFVVRDVPASVRHYVHAFGFTEDFVYGDLPFYAGVYRGRVAIHLQDATKTDRPVGGGCVCLFVGDAMAIHAELVSSRVEIAVEPAPRDYGLVDLRVDDPDGNQLVWSSDIETRS